MEEELISNKKVTKSIKQNHAKAYETLGYPNGWYAVGLSTELRKGKMLTIPFIGNDIIAFRTSSGTLSISDAYCPHLGAHFGYGGKVVGDHLFCPFHGFEFNSTGTCVKTAYGTKPPKNAKLYMWPTKETNGFILVYYHKNKEAPTWEIPALENDWNDWTPLRYERFILKDHPQEITENSVDVGHFPLTHGYKEVTILNDFIIDKHYLSSHYSFRKTLPKLLNILGLKGIKINIRTHIYGLGYSFVEVWIPILKFNIRMWVLPTPIDLEKLTLRLVMSKKRAYGILSIFDNLIAKFILKGFAMDTQSDFDIWENKIYLEKPPLAKGDGPIGDFRRWTRQFYTD